MEEGAEGSRSEECDGKGTQPVVTDSERGGGGHEPRHMGGL